MKIQIDIPNNLNKQLKYYKLDKDLTSLQEAIIQVLSKFFDVKSQGGEVEQHTKRSKF